MILSTQKLLSLPMFRPAEQPPGKAVANILLTNPPQWADKDPFYRGGSPEGGFLFFGKTSIFPEQLVWTPPLFWEWNAEAPPLNVQWEPRQYPYSAGVYLKKENENPLGTLFLARSCFDRRQIITVVYPPPKWPKGYFSFVSKYQRGDLAFLNSPMPVYGFGVYCVVGPFLFLRAFYPGEPMKVLILEFEGDLPESEFSSEKVFIAGVLPAGEDSTGELSTTDEFALVYTDPLKFPRVLWNIHLSNPDEVEELVKFPRAFPVGWPRVVGYNLFEEVAVKC